jgi:hypothetical protein
MSTLLEQAVAYIRAGDIEKGRPILIEFLKQNPRDENAWLWMTKCVTDPEQKRYCFDRVLKINPQIQFAIRGLKRLNKPVSPIVQPKVIPPQPAKKKVLSLAVAIAIVGIFCISGLFGFALLSNRSRANVLSPQDVFEVSAVEVVKDDGYTVTSDVCEVVSTERYLSSAGGGKIVFHAFRITKPDLGSEVVVLFTSNHTAADGMGLLNTVNSEAVRLFPNFPDATRRSDEPITVDTAGAQEALECAQKVGGPSQLDFGTFDHEAWRLEAIQRFGPEETFDDGSKEDHVRLALSICKQSSSERETMLTTLGADYEGSDQQFILETFCPHVK